MGKIVQVVQQVKIMNFILMFICILGFCYQVYLISNQYILGKTVVNIEVKRLTAQPFPAITVCLWERFLSISKLSKLNGFNNESYQDYIELVEQMVKSNNFTNKYKLRGFYQRISTNNLHEKILNFHELFELNVSPESIKIHVISNTVSVINQTFFKRVKTNKYEFTKPIHSAVLYGTEVFGWKCYTYFSALEEYWNELQIDFEKFTLTITNNFSEYATVYHYKIAFTECFTGIKHL